MAVWVEDLTEDSFVSLLYNWMAYTNLQVDNFTLSDSLVFTSNDLPSQQIDYAFCQVKYNILLLIK